MKDKREYNQWLGKRIKSARKHFGFTQEKIAKELDIPRTTYLYLETGLSDVGSYYILSLSNIYKITPAYFFSSSVILPNQQHNE